MPDKCQSHDKCFQRIDDQIADMRDDLHRGFNELKEMLHAGALLHTEFRMRFDSHEQAIANLQREIGQLKAVPERRWGQVENQLFMLAGKALWVVLGAAIWAIYNGYAGK